MVQAQQVNGMEITELGKSQNTSVLDLLLSCRTLKTYTCLVSNSSLET